MLSLSLNLPKYRLSIRLAKRRGPLFPLFHEAKNVRVGSRVSRLFRLLFEHINIKKILGANLALSIFATSLFPHHLAKNAIAQVDQSVIQAQVSFATEHSIRFPLDNKITVNQGFRTFHPGIDFEGITGDPVYAVMSGEVEAIQYSKVAYGNAILVYHGNGMETLYAHLSKILVKEHDKVNTQIPVGLVGKTGHATGDHLHFEIRSQGVPINPLPVLPKI